MDGSVDGTMDGAVVGAVDGDGGSGSEGNVNVII